MKRLLITTALLTGALVSSIAHASPYAELNIGGAFPMDSDFNQSVSPDAKISFKPSFALTAAAGYSYNNGFRTELEYGYQAPEIDKLTGTISGIPVTLTGSGSSINAHTFMANSYYDFSTGYKITPFIGGGLGLAVLSSNTSGPKVGYYTVTSNDSAAAFAYQFTAGASYPVTDKVAITASYRYLGTSEATFKTNAYQNLTLLAAGDSKVSYSSNVLRVGLRYSF